jgi:hypothetical protein
VDGAGLQGWRSTSAWTARRPGPRSVLASAPAGRSGPTACCRRHPRTSRSDPRGR